MKKRREPSKLFKRHERIYSKWKSDDNTTCLYTFRNQSEEVIYRYLKMKNANKINYVSSKRPVNPNPHVSLLSLQSLVQYFEECYERKEVR